MKRAALLPVLVLACAFPLQAQEKPRINVNGESVVYVKPDQVVVTFGIETRDAEIMASKQKNNDIMKRALAVAKELGIPDKNIQTDQLSIEPRYRNNFENDQFLGYFVRNTLAITLSDIGKLESLITKALQSGVNYIHGVSFETTELRKFRDQARESALKAAKEKAEAMASVLGQSVGGPLQITEGGGVVYPSWSGWGYGRGSMITQNSVQVAPSTPAENGDTVALGKIAVRAGVSVVFEMITK